MNCTLHILKGDKNPAKRPEVREKMRLAALKIGNSICPHCGKNGRGNSMKRWHFDNCKAIK